MATRIDARPDSDGVIRVICGGELLEIVVAPGGPVGDQSRRSDDPFGAPVAYLVVTDRNGRIDVEAAISRLSQEVYTMSPGGPRSLVLRADMIDLHGVASLRQAMDTEGHEMTLAIELSEVSAATSTAVIRNQF